MNDLEHEPTIDARSLARRIFECMITMDFRGSQMLIGIAQRAGVEGETRSHMQRMFDVGSAWAIDRLSLERMLLHAERPTRRTRSRRSDYRLSATTDELAAQLLAHEKALDLFCGATN